jgi:DNA modification methylase
VSVLLVQGNARHIPLTDASVHVCCTSPPYWGLRSYNIGVNNGEIGQEKCHDCLAWARHEPPCAACWVCAMRAVFAEVHRVMRPEATLWLNCGDAMARSGAAPPRRDHSSGHGLGTYGQQGYSAACAMPARAPGPLPEKNLLGLPWRLALALQADGWILRSEIIWHKLNPMPESVQDRPTRAHEQVFLFSKQWRYYFDMEGVREPQSSADNALNPHGRSGVSLDDYTPIRPEGAGIRKPITMRYRLWNPNGRAMRSVLSLASEPTPYAHFATFGTELVRRCLRAGAPAQVCRRCKAPWVRQVEREGGNWEERKAAGAPPRYGMNNNKGHAITHYGSSLGTTTGFAPTCRCGAPGDGKAICFDPFVGSGTVPLVARELGHHALGMDLSFPYLHAIARERLGLAALARWHGQARPCPRLAFADLPLFAPVEDTP